MRYSIQKIVEDPETLSEIELLLSNYDVSIEFRMMGCYYSIPSTKVDSLQGPVGWQGPYVDGKPQTWPSSCFMVEIKANVDKSITDTIEPIPLPKHSDLGDGFALKFSNVVESRVDPHWENVIVKTPYADEIMAIVRKYKPDVTEDFFKPFCDRDHDYHDYYELQGNMVYEEYGYKYHPAVITYSDKLTEINFLIEVRRFDEHFDRLIKLMDQAGVAASR